MSLGLAEIVAVFLRDNDRRARFLARGDAELLGLLLGVETCDALRETPERAADLLCCLIAEIDTRIASHLDHVLHQPAFQKLEGSWRGLNWLIGQTARLRSVQCRVLPASWADISSDFANNAVPMPENAQSGETIMDVGRTAIYALVHQREYNQAGGRPFGLLVVDHEAGPRSGDGDPAADVEILESLARVAALSFAPVVIGAAPEILVEAPAPDGFGHLAGVADPADVMQVARGPDGAEGASGRARFYRRFQALRRQAASRFMAIVMPRVLARVPWVDDATRGEGFRYAEDATDARSRCWMTACYAFASVVIRAASRYGWPADICGTDSGREGGGIVTGLPDEPFAFDSRFSLPRLPLDVVWLEGQEREVRKGEEHGLVTAGFLPLSARPFGIEPAFDSARSLHDVSGGQSRELFADARVASQFNAVLCASRFAHTIKVRGRDMVASMRTAAALEAELWEWFRPYVNRSASASSQLRAQSPLVEAKVSVQEMVDKPGAFTCAFKLRPYYQLEGIAPELTFQTELGVPAA